MSREQWGHGYWKGVADAKNGRVSDIALEAKYWIANMCISNYEKSYDRSLYPVKEWIWFCRFCGLSQKYARRIYDYVLDNNYHEFEKNEPLCCYVTGRPSGLWGGDYFVIPLHVYTKEKWQEIADKIREELKHG